MLCGHSKRFKGGAFGRARAERGRHARRIVAEALEPRQLLSFSPLTDVPPADPVVFSPQGDYAVAGLRGAAEAADLPTLSIADIALFEGNSGTWSAVFTLTLSSPSGDPVSFSYATRDGAATAGSDYTAATGSLTIEPGQMQITVAVAVLGDTDWENDERFHLDITNVQNAMPVSMTGRATIQNDDTPPDLYGNTISTSEFVGMGSWSDAIIPGDDVDMFAVTVEAGQTLSFDIDLPDSGLQSLLRLFDTTGVELAENLTAVGADPEYSASESFLQYTFAYAGTFYLGVSASLNADYDPLTGELAAVGSTGTYTVIIQQVTFDEPGNTLATALPVAVPTTVAQSISPAGDIDLYVFTVAAGDTVSMDLDLPAGEWSAYLRLFDSAGMELEANWYGAGPAPEFHWSEPFIEHRFAEAGTYYLGVSGSSNGWYNPVDGSGIEPMSETGDYTLIIERLAPQFRMSDLMNWVDEGDEAYITVERIGTEGWSSVSYMVTGLTATDGVDFAGSSGTLYFGPGEDVYSILIPTVENGVLGADKTLRVDLFDASEGYVIAPAAGSSGVFILDDDGNTTPTLYSPDIVAPEGTHPDAKVRLMLYFSRTSEAGITVKYGFAASDGTATLGSDYSISGGSSEGSVWGTEQYWDLSVVGDNIPEPDEYFYLTYNSSTNINLGNTGPVLITLLDDDSTGGGDPGSTMADATPIYLGDTVNEFITPETDVDMYAFTPTTVGQAVRMRISSSSWINLHMRLFDAAGNELNNSWNQLDYTFWDTSATYYLGVSVWPNTGYDPVTGNGAVPGDLTGDYTLEVLDRTQFPPDVSVSGAVITEPTAGQATMLVSMILQYPWPEALDVPYRTADDAWLPETSATAGLDYEPASGTLHFEPNQTIVTFSVIVYSDAIEEESEHFFIWVTQPDSGSEWGYYAYIHPTDHNDQISEAMPLSVGTPAANELGHGSDVNMHAFTAMAGQTLTFDLDIPAGSGLAYSNLRLFAGDGTALAMSTYYAHGPGEPPTPEPSLRYTFTEAGTYFLGVASYYNQSYDALTGDDDAESYWYGPYVLLVTDDTLPAVSIGNAAAPAGSGSITFTVSLTHAYNPAVLVDFTTVDGSAIAGVDYAATTGTLTFAPGQTSATITVPILVSSLESEKTFSVVLSNARSQVYVDASSPWADAAVTIASATGIGTIQSGSAPPNQIIGTAGPDEYSVVWDSEAGLVRVYLGLDGTGTLVRTLPQAGLTSVQFLTGDEDDTVVVFGLPAGVALSFDGGGDDDTLILKTPSWGMAAGTVTSVESFVATSNAFVVLDAANAFNSINVVGNASVKIVGGSGDKTLACAELDVAGWLDIGDCELLITPPPGEHAGMLAQVNAWVRSSRNAVPLWSGQGITSTIAANDPLWGVGTFNGPSQGQILVKATFNGDMDGNKALDGDDFFLMDLALLAGSTDPGWAGGDFNYDQVMDGADFLLADRAFLGQTAPTPLGTAAVPALPISPAAPGLFAASTAIADKDIWPADEDVWEA